MIKECIREYRFLISDNGEITCSILSYDNIRVHTLRSKTFNAMITIAHIMKHDVQHFLEWDEIDIAKR